MRPAGADTSNNAASGNKTFICTEVSRVVSRISCEYLQSTITRCCSSSIGRESSDVVGEAGDVVPVGAVRVVGGGGVAVGLVRDAALPRPAGLPPRVAGGAVVRPALTRAAAAVGQLSSVIEAGRHYL